jgi:hypothetical protein
MPPLQGMGAPCARQAVDCVSITYDALTDKLGSAVSNLAHEISRLRGIIAVPGAILTNDLAKRVTHVLLEDAIDEQIDKIRLATGVITEMNDVLRGKIGSLKIL